MQLVLQLFTAVPLNSLVSPVNNCRIARVLDLRPRRTENSPAQPVQDRILEQYLESTTENETCVAKKFQVLPSSTSTTCTDMKKPVMEILAVVCPDIVMAGVSLWVQTMVGCGCGSGGTNSNLGFERRSYTGMSDGTITIICDNVGQQVYNSLDLTSCLHIPACTTSVNEAVAYRAQAVRENKEHATPSPWGRDRL